VCFVVAAFLVKASCPVLVLFTFQARPNELTNGVINAAFMLLFKDLIRLFACYNDGIINLLGKFLALKTNKYI